MEVHVVAEIHLQPMKDPMSEQVDAQKKAVTLWEACAGAGSWQDLWRKEPMLEHVYWKILVDKTLKNETITYLISGADAVEAQCKRFEVRTSEGGRVLFSADEDEIVIGADRLKVTDESRGYEAIDYCLIDLSFIDSFIFHQGNNSALKRINYSLEHKPECSKF
ncbi:hypothetical protein BTVI_53876 [Pitangus sulphuratus]|nr:hypothetical protein BTVI_53876 [Pitangus sulphuratus]